MTRDEALGILHEFAQAESIRKHAYAVEAAVRGYARILGEDEEYWGVVGLLHDFDWEIHPELPDHPLKGAEILRERGLLRSWSRTYSPADFSGVPRDTALRKVLFAVDELSRFVIAVALVRPSRSLDDLEPKSVKKKLKDKSFAAAVNRDEIQQGAEALGLVWTNIQNVIAALREVSAEVGL